jgi:hypothetical protein
MVRLALSFVVVLGVLLAAGAALSNSSRSSPRPLLRAVSLTPLELRGTNFEDREAVRLTLTAGPAKIVRSARANDAGTFTVDFGWVALDPCSGGAVVVKAVGARGSQASYKRLCKPAEPGKPSVTLVNPR